LPNYEFDGIVIASYPGDFYREFSVYHATKSRVYFKRFTTIPNDNIDFAQNYLPKMDKLYDITNDAHLDALIHRYTQSPFIFLSVDLYALQGLRELYVKVIRQRLRELYVQVMHSKNREKGHSLINVPRNLSEIQFQKLERMVKWCRENHKQII